MRYLTYDEYVLFRGAPLEPSVFTGYAFQAESTLDYYTYNRLAYHPLEHQPPKTQEAVKFCMMELIKLLVAQDRLSGVYTDEDGNIVNGQIASQSNDDVSVTFNVMNPATASDAIKRKITGTINHYLAGCINDVGQFLLYSGIYPNE